jgi:hypothetical protein
MEVADVVSYENEKPFLLSLIVVDSIVAFYDISIDSIIKICELRIASTWASSPRRCPVLPETTFPSITKSEPMQRQKG